MVDQTGGSWNPTADWLRRIDVLQRTQIAASTFLKTSSLGLLGFGQLLR
jgi:hypothetical protein